MRALLLLPALAAGSMTGALLSCGPSAGEIEFAASHPVVEGPLAVSGRLTLTGSLASAREGGINLRLVESWSGRVLLQRVYDLGDPLWDRRDEEQGLYFALTPEFALDARPPVRAPIALEAVHLPPGIAVEPSADDERVSVVWTPGVRERDLVLHVAVDLASGHPGDVDDR